jgi:pimeloyl-ACP methyl ester carboxylesterase
VKNKTSTTREISFNQFRMVLLLVLFVFFNCIELFSASGSVARKMIYAYSQNIHINYEKIGSGDKKIVLLHGFGNSLHTWDDIKELFPKDAYTLFLIDLKGFGNSSKPFDDKYTIHEQAKIVVQFIKDIYTDSLYLIGHSFGGAVALLTQISLINDKSKARIRKLILIDCLAYVQEMPSFIDYLKIPVLNKLTFLLPDKFKAEYVLKKIFYDRTKVNEKLINRYASFYTGENLEYAFVTSAKQINPNEYDKIINAYKGIPTSCLIIWGKNDPIISVDVAIRLSKELPNAKLVIIKNCGHVPQEEKPIETFKRIYAFIEGN